MGIGFATTYSNGTTKFFTPWSEKTIEQKKEYYKRLDDRNARGFFL
jgi:hypothetical protein